MWCVPTLNTSICPQKKEVVAQHPPDFNPVRCLELPVDAPVESDLWHSLRSYLGTWPMKGCKAKSSNLLIFFLWFAGAIAFGGFIFWILEVFQTNSWQSCRFRLSVTTQQHGEALCAPWVGEQVFTALKGEPNIGKPSTWQTKASNNWTIELKFQLPLIYGSLHTYIYNIDLYNALTTEAHRMSSMVPRPPQFCWWPFTLMHPTYLGHVWKLIHPDDQQKDCFTWKLNGKRSWVMLVPQKSGYNFAWMLPLFRSTTW